MNKVIDRFEGSYKFLSNFYPCKVEYDGLLFHNTEAAYQAAKTLDLETRKFISSLVEPNLAKKAGQMVDMRPDWHMVKFQIMYDILWIKFNQPDLKEKLLETGDAELIEGNWWHDNIWGVCNCGNCPTHKVGPGQNHLGKTLMKIRNDLR